MIVNARFFHGITSLGLICGAFAIGLWALARVRIEFMILYAVILILFSLLIVMIYCAKCPGQTCGCAHVLPGMIARHMPARDGRHYSAADYIAVGALFTALVAVPQKILWRDPRLFYSFWAVMAAGVFEILLFVCPGCGNSTCLMCRKTDT